MQLFHSRQSFQATEKITVDIPDAYNGPQPAPQSGFAPTAISKKELASLCFG